MEIQLSSVLVISNGQLELKMYYLKTISTVLQ